MYYKTHFWDAEKDPVCVLGEENCGGWGKNGRVVIFLMEECHVSCVLLSIAFSSVSGLSQVSASPK